MRIRSYSALILFLLVSSSLILSLSGCSRESNKSKEQAIAVAKQEALRRGWNRIEVDDVRLDGTNWIVIVWRLPKTPDANAFVEVSSNGNLVSFNGSP
jgi:hypothetical protein